jgi:hypothetical protein
MLNTAKEGCGRFPNKRHQIQLQSKIVDFNLKGDVSFKIGCVQDWSKLKISRPCIKQPNNVNGPWTTVREWRTNKTTCYPSLIILPWIKIHNSCITDKQYNLLPYQYFETINKMRKTK